MKRCYTCQKRGIDNTTFCTRCGSSFDLRYCPKLHPNPRHAVYCQFCGSSDLSRPDNRPQKPPTWLILLAVFAISVVIGMVVAHLLSLAAENLVAPFMVVVGMFCVALGLAIRAH